MNEQNLKRGNPDTQFKSGREAAENGRKGGIASGESKRERKTLREYLQIALDAEIKDKNSGETYTKWQATAISIANGMAKGNVKMIDSGAKLLGEYVQKQEIEQKIVEITLDEKKRQILEKIKLLQDE